MGRSQVLYNRTKGRNRNRAGRGGNHDSTASKSSSTNHRRQGLATQIPRQFHPSESLDRHSPKDYEQEYEVLFAGRSTYLSSSGGNKSDEEDLALGDNSNYGSICIPSMAATLESMDITKRLRIPMHVASRAFPEKMRIAEEEKHQEQKDAAPQAVASLNTASPEDNVRSSSDPESANLEDWLDDVCGMDNGSNAKKDTEPTKAVVSNVADENLNATKQTENSASNNATPEESITNTVEDNGEDNLDDWLDSMIE